MKIARKHIGWYLAACSADARVVSTWRRRLCTDDDAGRVLSGLAAFYSETMGVAA